jgi:hypothetical protein
MNHDTKMRCSNDARITSISPMSPLPIKAIAIVINMRPAGLEVVGELISSIKDFQLSNAFARNTTTDTPPMYEHAE